MTNELLTLLKLRYNCEFRMAPKSQCVRLGAQFMASAYAAPVRQFCVRFFENEEEIYEVLNSEYVNVFNIGENFEIVEYFDD